MAEASWHMVSPNNNALKNKFFHERLDIESTGAVYLHMNSIRVITSIYSSCHYRCTFLLVEIQAHTIYHGKLRYLNIAITLTLGAGPFFYCMSLTDREVLVVVCRPCLEEEEDEQDISPFQILSCDSGTNCSWSCIGRASVPYTTESGEQEINIFVKLPMKTGSSLHASACTHVILLLNFQINTYVRRL